MNRLTPYAILSALTLLAVTSPTPSALAQDEDNGRRDSFDVPDDATSENNERLERIIDRFPESDSNEDGILDATEARAFIAAFQERQREERAQREQDRGQDRGRGRGRTRRLRPAHTDVAFGDDPTHKLDLYLAESDEPTPLVVYFHPGQFITGSKSDIEIDTRALVEQGISVASVNYRLTREEPFPACFEDAARAIQFLRLNAEEYNLDIERFASAGHDAGGNLALYLALHDDLAKRRRPGAEDTHDPVTDPYNERGLTQQSTRVIAAVAWHPMASYDPRYWNDNDLPLNNHERYLPAYLGLNFVDPFTDRFAIEIVEDVSPAALVSEDDPPVLLLNNFPELEINEETSWTVMRLHPRHSKLLQETLGDHGVEAIVRYRGMENDPGTSHIDFLAERLIGGSADE